MICQVCGKSSKQMKVCSKCHNAKYCSRECQVEDWQHGGHKEECKASVEPKKMTKKKAGSGKVLKKAEKKNMEQFLYEREQENSMQGDDLEQ
jgi:hypothetical protein